MSSMNYVILMGGVTRDPELRHTRGGVAVAKFGLAITERFRDKAGADRETVCYVDVDAWARLGEVCAEHLRKGSSALVQGRLQFEQWEDREGGKRSKLSVRADQVEFLDRPASSTPASEHGQPPPEQPRNKPSQASEASTPFDEEDDPPF